MTIDDLLADPRPWIEIPEAGAVGYGVGTSQSYVYADRGVIPTKRIGQRRRVVPRIEFLRSLGVEPDGAPSPVVEGPGPA